MFRHHLQHLEIYCQYYCVSYRHILTKSFYNIFKSWNCNIAMKYVLIFDKNVATIFQLQWNIGNIPDIFLQCSVLCGIYIFLLTIFQQLTVAFFNTFIVGTVILPND